MGTGQRGLLAGTQLEHGAVGLASSREIYKPRPVPFEWVVKKGSRSAPAGFGHARAVVEHIQRYAAVIAQRSADLYRSRPFAAMPVH
jgi:hypothetical protein